MTDLVSLLFIAMIPIDFKITNFSLHLYSILCIIYMHTLFQSCRFPIYTFNSNISLIFWARLLFFVHYCMLQLDTTYSVPASSSISISMLHHFNISYSAFMPWRGWLWCLTGLENVKQVVKRTDLVGHKSLGGVSKWYRDFYFNWTSKHCKHTIF